MKNSINTVFDQEIIELRRIRHEYFLEFGISSRPPGVERWNDLHRMKSDLEEILLQGPIGLDGENA